MENLISKPPKLIKLYNHGHCACPTGHPRPIYCSKRRADNNEDWCLFIIVQFVNGNCEAEIEGLHSRCQTYFTN